MNKILGWISGIVFVVLCISFFLYEKGLIPSGSLIFVALGVGAIYSIWIDSFWKKVSCADYTDKHFKKLIDMLVSHRKDEKTVHVIMNNIRDERMRDALSRNHISAIDQLINSDKGKHQLHRVVRDLCELSREYYVKRFTEIVRTKTKGHIPHKTNENFIEVLGGHTINCFMEVGGYPTWINVYDILQPILEQSSRDDVDKLLLEVERRFKFTRTKKSDYLQVFEAHYQLFQSIRKWNMERAVRA